MNERKRKEKRCKRAGGERLRIKRARGGGKMNESWRIVINALDVYIVRCEVVFMRETSIQGAL